MCLGRHEVSELVGKTALVQGFGLTENGTQSNGLLQANAKLISNENCAKYISHNISDDLIGKKTIKDGLPFGIVDQVLCSMGELNEETERYSVSIWVLLTYLLIMNIIQNAALKVQISDQKK